MSHTHPVYGYTDKCMHSLQTPHSLNSCKKCSTLSWSMVALGLKAKFDSTVDPGAQFLQPTQT